MIKISHAIMPAMWVLAQLADELPPADGGIGFWLSLSMWLLWSTATVLTFAYAAFWLWMMIECLRSEPDRYFWVWLLIVAPFPGAIVYALTRYYPTLDRRSAGFVGRWTRGKELARLEAAAQQIGNPHQFILWGDALRSVGQWSSAGEAYAHALRKDSQNLQALWGAALVAEQAGRWNEVEQLTRTILTQDPQYKFGDVSLRHGIALIERQQPDAARKHLEQHIQRWRHPEGLYRLALLCHETGDDPAAREYLLALLQDLNASPHAIARKHGRWKSRAQKLLRQVR